uniref:Heparanase 2 (inactive) n=1 Tax=Zonotrichia albicollis TaxID=44394 RepID=A0A8D2QDH0_ZONAL
DGSWFEPQSNSYSRKLCISVFQGLLGLQHFGISQDLSTDKSAGPDSPELAGDRRALPVEKPPGVKGRTLILLDVNTKSPVRIISENFLSLQLDPSIIHDGWLDFLSSRRLVTLARGLAPAFLRFAGKRTDFLQFHNVKNPAKSRGGPGPDYYLKNYEDGEPRGGGGRCSGGLREPGGPVP